MIMMMMLIAKRIKVIDTSILRNFYRQFNNKKMKNEQNSGR